MKATQNAENLKVELETSGNVTEVEKIKETELKDWVKEVVMLVRLEEKGYSFEVLQDKYPTLEIQDVIFNGDEIEVVLKVNEVTEK